MPDRLFRGAGGPIAADVANAQQLDPRGRAVRRAAAEQLPERIADLAEDALDLLCERRALPCFAVLDVNVERRLIDTCESIDSWVVSHVVFSIEWDGVRRARIRVAFRSTIAHANRAVRIDSILGSEPRGPIP
ncbi:hypothetical protein [Burkholderia oklahomensis]|uniref:hypothetical protein n=1 Tax=Burkholderia oklahomensis TaxID=342113 RepID=UPI0022B7627A|nr:hypothetical protein [Burkholderia oklahomensis]